MIEMQRSTMVQETRNAFQNAMQDKFIKAIEHLTGRHVLVFKSNHHIGPDIEIELFLLTPNEDSSQTTTSRPNPSQPRTVPGSVALRSRNAEASTRRRAPGRYRHHWDAGWS